MDQKRSPRRKALSLLLALCLILELLPVPALAAEAAPADHWAASYLNQMVEWGFIRADQAKNPDKKLTRADFMSIVNRAYGYHEVGPTPFEDVNEYDWYYDDVGIAYTARYINGTSPTTASPNDTLDRETAATILGRNMMLQESAGEILDFSDARNISNWARGTIKSSMEHYLVSGYDDGTFRPQQAMSWGEIAALVTRTIGTPLQDAGDYALGGVFGNVTVTSPGVTLRDSVISGDLYITGGVGLGGIKLENINVLGRIIASGTGTSEGGASILLRNVTADELLVDNLQDKEVSIQADGITEIGKTTVRSSAYIEDNTPEGLGLHLISFEADWYGEDDEVPEGWTPPRLTLAGRIEEVINKTPNSIVHVAKGTVAKLTVDEEATNSQVIIDRGAVVKELILDTGVTVTGEGDITHLEVNAPGCNIAMLPDEIVIRPGITAIIAGEEMDSMSAEEFLLDPMILAGYPKAQDIAPTSLEAVFATNKKGRIYWAVSAITDGSIGADDLVKPPSYGSKAVRWGTTDSPRGNEETVAKITGLQPGGSYYLSAVLEDQKGQLSPVKVISFTTPDNTVPAFNTGYPYMSKVSPRDSVVVVSTNKDCKLYYALLPQGATPPTETELRTNAVAGALGYGVRDAQKNVEDTFRVNDVILAEQTTYILYLWLVDADGANKSAIVPLPFTTKDETPPEFIIEPTVIKVDRTSVTMTFRLNEDGVVYWVAIPANTTNYPKPEPGTDYETAPPNSMYGMLQIENGMNIGADGKSGRVNCKGNVDGTITVSGMLPETAYDFYYMAKDTAGNYTEVWKKITISPLDENGPKFSQSFSDSSSIDGKSDPTSNTAIYLDVTEDVRYTGEGGGTSFLDLYQAVKDAKTETEKNAAKNKLAANIYGAIKLHKIDLYDNSEETLNYKYQVGQYPNGDWDIDYTEVIVEAHEGGIRITFPNSALHLENGGQYYFTISNITDVSANQNPIVPSTVDFYSNEALSKGGGHDVPVFIVEFARVDFSTPGLDDLPIKRDGNVNPYTRPEGGYEDGDYVRRDMSFRMRPVSTETVANNVRYDLLLWTDSNVTFDLYYRVVDAAGKRIDTEGAYPDTYNIPNSTQSLSKNDYLLTHLGKNSGQTADVNGWFYLGNSGPMNPTNNSWSGRSVNYYKDFNNCSATSFPQLNKMNSNLRYEVIIHLTSMEDVQEMQDGAETWRNWNGEVKFYANVAAGQGDNLENLGGSLTQKNWADAKKKGLGLGAVSIGRNNTHEEPIDTQELSRLFTDSRLPRFDGDAPSFDPGPDFVDVDLRFSTAGTLYYVIGKADTGAEHLPEITTTRTLVTAIPGGENLPEGQPGSAAGELLPVNGQPNTYYIRMSDVDKDNPSTSLAPTESGAAMQKWMIGGIKENPNLAATSDDPEKENLIVRPLNQYIFNPKGQSETLGAIYGNFPFQGRTVETLTINGLTPETDYFAYFVIKGEADTLSHVYIYHFKTPKATKPKITLGNYNVPNHDEYAGAKISTDIDSQLQYYVFSRTDAEREEFSILREPVYVSKEYGEKSGKVDTSNGTVKNPETGEDAYVMSAYDALLNTFLWRHDSARPSTDEGFSVFDIYASTALKEDMSNFLHGRFWGEYMKTQIQSWEDSGGEIDLKGKNVRNEPLENCPAGTEFVILAVAHVPNPGSASPATYETFAGYAPIRAGRATTVDIDRWFTSFQMGQKGDPYYNGQIYVVFKPELYFDSSQKIKLDNSNIASWAGVVNSTGGRVKISVESHDSQQTMLKFDGQWNFGDMIYIPASSLRDVNGGVATSDMIIRIEKMPNDTGLRATLEWTPKKNPDHYDHPYVEVDRNISVYFDIVTGSVKPNATGKAEISKSTGKQTLYISPGTTELKIKAQVSPGNMTVTPTWTSSNQNVVKVNQSGGDGDDDNNNPFTTTVTVVGPGKTTIHIMLNGADGAGNPVTAQTYDLDVVVYGLSLNGATGAGSVGNNVLTWDLSKSTSGSTLTIKSDAPLDTDIPLGSATITSAGNVFTQSGAVTWNAERTEIYISIVKSGNTPSNGVDTITVTIGPLTCEFAVTFTGSESGLPITPAPGPTP